MTQIEEKTIEKVGELRNNLVVVALCELRARRVDLSRLYRPQRHWSTPQLLRPLALSCLRTRRVGCVFQNLAPFKEARVTSGPRTLRQTVEVSNRILEL